MAIGLIEGDECGRDGCTGVMSIVESDGGCSCHICPPCSYCVDAEFRCNECDSLAEAPEQENTTWNHIPQQYQRPSIEDLFKALSGDVIDWVNVTPANSYYFMVVRGRYPDGTTKDQIKACFNLCFGYSYLDMSNGVFKLKYYTD